MMNCILNSVHLSYHNAKATLDLLNSQIRELCRQAPPTHQQVCNEEAAHPRAFRSQLCKEQQEGKKNPQNGSHRSVVICDTHSISKEPNWL